MPPRDADLLARPRMRARDTVRTALVGVLAQRLRAVLAALGIAIGVAAIVTVIGLSSSSQAAVDAQFDRVGSNLLTATPGADLTGPRPLALSAATAVAGIDGVTAVSFQALIDGVTVRPNPLVPVADTSGVSVRAIDASLPGTLGAELAAGRGFDAATRATPTVVLGATSAQRLGLHVGDLAYVGDRWMTVLGVLRPVLLDEDLDTAALVGAPYARRHPFGRPLTIGQLYVRTADRALDRVRELVGPTADPASPDSVTVTRPTDTLRAEAITRSALNGLFIGLGAVSLLIGGVGVANVMVIAVLERRGEIGLRRALGAIRSQIAFQFILEALLLSLLGAAAGAALGGGVVVGVSLARGWPPVLPVPAAGAAVAASVLVGILAGVVPAARAARLAPTEALRSV
jgi:putative ABC transport system permease protein